MAKVAENELANGERRGLSHARKCKEDVHTSQNIFRLKNPTVVLNLAVKQLSGVALAFFGKRAAFTASAEYSQEGQSNQIFGGMELQPSTAAVGSGAATFTVL